MRSEFLALANSVKVSDRDFENLLITKSVETDAFGLMIRVLGNEVMNSNDVAKFMSALEGGSNDLLWLAFSRQHLTLSGILYVEKWARYV